MAGFVLLAVLATPAAARTLHFRGEAVAVPHGWPIYRLAEHPRMCVRLDRRAVYLGTPGAGQRCPSNAIGRRRAILVDPGARVRVRAQASSGVSTPGSSASGAEVFTGLGFDACATPSSRAMAAWAASPYRAIGVYIGGANRACAQPNLTATWVGEQVAEDWHLIPTYVGLQAPTSSCSSCAPFSSNTGKASVQGTEAASDAVAKAQSVGIGPGSPIYFDMEAYTRTSSATGATLAFLSAWTAQLHSLGYASGAYSSSSSGIADLARAIGGPYTLPDDIWTANWNDARNTLDPYLPSSAWASHQRIHQYHGGHNEAYGLMTINIDNDYVDGATVGAATRPALPPLTVGHVKPVAGTVSVWVRCGWSEGQTCPGQIVLRTHARLPLRSRPGIPKRIVRIAVGHRTFALAGGRSHTFRIALDSRGQPLLRERGLLKAQLLVAIPEARTTRAVRLRQSR
ncbi:MAG TPA: glycoside hydrolase domain-containing protein [Solirubrobacterales bacterium]|nr:glycoside hydrolase domain-containing protein [Solirubrobacterales bacterium]